MQAFRTDAQRSHVRKFNEVMDAFEDSDELNIDTRVTSNTCTRKRDVTSNRYHMALM